MRLLLADLVPDPAAFLAEHWGRAPYARPTGAAPLAALATPERLARWLADPDADVVAVRDGAAVADRPRTLAGARALLDAGATVAFRHLERSDTPLAELGRRLGAELTGTPNVHVYWTPAGHGSFGWHCDPEDVFLLQVGGRKRYRFRENTQHRWPLAETLRHAGAAHGERTPVGEAVLEPGGWLYLPAGWWHDVHAESESLAISVGLLAPTPIDLLDRLRAALLHDERWRARLPPLGHAAPGDDAAKLERWQGALARMAGELAAILGDEAAQRRMLRETLLQAWVRPGPRPRG